MSLRRQPRRLVLTSKGGVPASEDQNRESIERVSKKFRYLLMTILLRHDRDVNRL